MDKTTEGPILIYSVTYYSTYWLLLHKDTSKAQGTYYLWRAYSEQGKYPCIMWSLMPMMPDCVNSSKIEWTLRNDSANHFWGPWCISHPVNPWLLWPNLDVAFSNVHMAADWQCLSGTDDRGCEPLIALVKPWCSVLEYLRSCRLTAPTPKNTL